MPNARDLAKLSLVVNSVHNSIRPKDDLANVITPIFRNDAPEFWNSCRWSVSEINSYPNDIAD